MQLSPEGRTLFQQHLQTALRQPCGVCGTGNWQVEDAIFELREFNGGPLTNEGAIKPLMALTCNACGHVVFMSPLKAGIISIQQQAAPVAQPEAVEVSEED